MTVLDGEKGWHIFLCFGQCEPAIYPYHISSVLYKEDNKKTHVDMLMNNTERHDILNTSSISGAYRQAEARLCGMPDTSSRP